MLTPPMTTFSPGFLLRTNMDTLREVESAQAHPADESS
jgi:hypothetical protein